MKRCELLILGMVFGLVQGHAQNLDTKDLHASFDEFRKSVRQDFEDFRKKCMDDYVEFVKNPWKSFEETKPVPKPKENPDPPVVIPEEEKNKPVEDKPVIIEEVIKPVPVEPQPQPVEPIKEVPVVTAKTVDFTFFGTQGQVRFDEADRIVMRGCSETSVSEALANIDARKYDNMLRDCLSMRKDLGLSDWGYVQMLKALSDQVCGQGTNESALMLAYLYMQSGYKMRLASDGNKLYMLFASKYQIFDRNSYTLGNDLYYGVEALPSRLYICQASFPKEKGLSLMIQDNQRFSQSNTASRTITSKKYSDVKVSVSVNKNLIDFYNTYPSSMLDGNVMTRWAMYANTPIDGQVKSQVYPTLKKLLSGLSELEAVSRLLNLVQTGFVYEYDDKVWGGDRAFFAEETLFYPYCDCEDRSILFTRLVRDLVGLDCILVFYPGHLAAAVAFTEEVSGDYIQLNGRKFVISDPTYIGAPVGRTMPKMNNQTAKVIILKK